MEKHAHGGNLLQLASIAGRTRESLLDFSVNVRPEGPPDFIHAALTRAFSHITAYPPPLAEEAAHAAAQRYGIPSDHFVFGNGSNELIHALARVFARRSAYIVEPAFSEYALACGRAGLAVRHIFLPPTFNEQTGIPPCQSSAATGQTDVTEASQRRASATTGHTDTIQQTIHALPDLPTATETSHTITSSTESAPAPGRNYINNLLTALANAPAGGLVFLANPANPSGRFLPRELCRELIASRPDLIFIIDEAFIEYVGPDEETSLIYDSGDTCLVLRSLTKFYAIPGVRAGFLVSGPATARLLQNELPAWNVNTFALAAACAVFADTGNYAADVRRQNAAAREDLAARLAGVNGLHVFPSSANYLLFQWKNAPHDLPARLLRQSGIALRDCSNYPGLEGGAWFRAAVRTPGDNCRLAEALRKAACSAESDATSPAEHHTAESDAISPAGHHAADKGTSTPESPRNSGGGTSTFDETRTRREDSKMPSRSSGNSPRIPDWLQPAGATEQSVTDKNGPARTPCPAADARTRRRPPALMLQGTSSNAGKSILAAAFCRIFRQDGFSVAPFKAQNMSLNSGVTASGEEMGRAQIVQAQAAMIDPDVRMNPILLKPQSDNGSQVVLLGKPVGQCRAREYYTKKNELWQHVAAAYDSLSSEHDLMVLEGAGSPGEVNLKSSDIVNMSMAAYAGANVLLVGDIDRGGVYASFLGTWMTFSPDEQRLLKGFLVNRFRGDATLLTGAHDYLLNHTGTPVLGVVPYIRDLRIPEEDMAGFSWTARKEKPGGSLDVAVLMPRHVSNYTDCEPLALEPDVHLRPVRAAEDWGSPDLVILPGSKSVVSDLEEIRRSGLADKLMRHAAEGKWIFGICGGLQMLGREILDPQAVESARASVPGLNLLDLSTTFSSQKVLVQVRNAQTPLNVPSGGYEIHQGLTRHGSSVQPLFRDGERICGYVTDRRWATYLHGVFDNDAFRRAFLDHIRQDVGLPPQGRQLLTYDPHAALDALAEVVRNSVDMRRIYALLKHQQNYQKNSTSMDF